MSPKKTTATGQRSKGFTEEERAAILDEGRLWPTGFAVKAVTAADEARIGALVKKAVPA